MRLRRCLLASAFWFALTTSSHLHAAPVTITDDAGRTVTLAEPARRIVSLAPHITELLFAAGAGDRVIGVDRMSDYPPEAKRLPNVGDAFSVNVEAILAMKPDLVIAFVYGPLAPALDRIAALGIPVLVCDPKSLDAVAERLTWIGTLIGNPTQAEQAAAAYRASIASLPKPTEGSTRKRVFIHVWHDPLITLGGKHVVSDIVSRCGGDNVFAQLEAPSPQVPVEAVLAANPDVMLGATRNGDSAEWQTFWMRHATINAVRDKRFVNVNADALFRMGPRVAEAARAVCTALTKPR